MSTVVCLVNTPTQRHDQRALPGLMDYPTIPPLGLGYVATAASEIVGPQNVDLIDAEHLHLSPAEAARRIAARDPAFVCINIASPNYAIAREIIHLAGRNLGRKMVVGGPHGILSPDDILLDSDIGEYVLGVCTGDGEPTIQAMLKGIDREHVPNLRYVDESGRVTSSDRNEHVTKEQLNSRILDRRFFANDPLVNGQKVESYVLSSRGCPFRCDFCAAPRLNGQLQRRSNQSLLEELKSLRTLGVNYVRFVDDLLLTSERQAATLKDVFDTLGIGSPDFGFEATARASIAATYQPATWEMLAMMGLEEIEIGIESGSPRVLKLMGKRTRIEAARRTVQQAVAHGIKVKGFLIVGYPTETSLELDLTLKLAADLKSIGGDAVRFSPVIAKAYPGTELYEQYRGLMQHFGDDTLIDLVEWCTKPLPAAVAELLKTRTRYNALHTLRGRPVTLSELTGGASLEEVLEALGNLILISGGMEKQYATKVNI
jgi:anaerobic magnesium-protoporphyrin IX monomethyl ester cyclase